MSASAFLLFLLSCLVVFFAGMVVVGLLTASPKESELEEFMAIARGCLEADALSLDIWNTHFNEPFDRGTYLQRIEAETRLGTPELVGSWRPLSDRPSVRPA